MIHSLINLSSRIYHVVTTTLLPPSLLPHPLLLPPLPRPLLPYPPPAPFNSYPLFTLITLSTTGSHQALSARGSGTKASIVKALSAPVSPVDSSDEEGPGTGQETGQTVKGHIHTLDTYC